MITRRSILALFGGAVAAPLAVKSAPAQPVPAEYQWVPKPSIGGGFDLMENPAWIAAQAERSHAASRYITQSNALMVKLQQTGKIRSVS